MNKAQESEYSLTDNISEHYKKFFDKFQEIEVIQIDKWRSIHVLAYLCKLYKSYYNLNYSFKFNNPAPSKSYEIYNIKKMANMLSANPVVLKNYIDWVFKFKIIEKKKRVTSLAYFTHQDIINEYKFKFLLNNKLPARSDRLPEDIIKVCCGNGFDITTYAELSFVIKMSGSSLLITELQKMNFRLDVLDKII